MKYFLLTVALLSPIALQAAEETEAEDLLIKQRQITYAQVKAPEGSISRKEIKKLRQYVRALNRQSKMRMLSQYQQQ